MNKSILNRLNDLESKGQISFPTGGIAYRQKDDSWKIHINNRIFCCTNSEKAILESSGDLHLLSYECCNKLEVNE